MAVNERAYHAYEGPKMPERSRVLVLPRYALGGVFGSRLFTAFFAGCFLWPVVCAVLIYLHHNASALRVLEIPVAKLLAIDARFFLVFLRVQGTFLGFLIALLVGPSLVSPDLRNNGMALYLSRPLTRTEYVAGKMGVLALLLSSITWIPGILLFVFQGSLEGFGWLVANLRIGAALFVASWLWILLLSLLALAVSATVKWRPLASAALIAIFFIAAALGTTFNAMFGTDWGSLLNLGQMVETVWSRLFGLAAPSAVPLWAAWGCLLAVCAVSLLLLAKKVRAYEVVR